MSILFHFQTLRLKKGLGKDMKTVDCSTIKKCFWWTTGKRCQKWIDGPLVVERQDMGSKNEDVNASRML